MSNQWTKVVLGSLLIALVAAGVAVACPTDAEKTAGIQVIEDYVAPGLNNELSGIYPHPSNDELYYVAANRKPVYRAGQKAMLPENLRGQILTVEKKSGEVVEAWDLGGVEYGGMAYGEGHLFVSSLEPAEILKVSAKDGEIVRRYPIAGPAGGLEFDAERNALIAQIFVGYPQLAVIDVESGATLEALWSDESAMGLAKVQGDILCTWVSSFDEHARAELRLIDGETGEVAGRVPLDEVHTSLAPASATGNLADGFLSLVATGSDGEVAVRHYSYTNDAVTW
ncbi:MAG: hypothetical protein AAF604_10520 [Acidobacteriota bacterium]